MSNEEKIAGAQNCLAQITSQMMKGKNAKFAISIEGWVETNNHDLRQFFLQCVACVCLKHQNSKEFISETRSGAFILPDIVNKVIMDNKEELGLAQNKYFSQFNRDDLEIGKD